MTPPTTSHPLPRNDPRPRPSPARRASVLPPAAPAPEACGYCAGSADACATIREDPGGIARDPFCRGGTAEPDDPDAVMLRMMKFGNPY